MSFNHQTAATALINFAGEARVEEFLGRLGLKALETPEESAALAIEAWLESTGKGHWVALLANVASDGKVVDPKFINDRPALLVAIHAAYPDLANSKRDASHWSSKCRTAAAKFGCTVTIPAKSGGATLGDRKARIAALKADQ